ncbi:KGGVGR-motif variant AAA ATPase [Streptomyces justiciae]|uniref:KGGVGR-motif variant AAA ATPase n=1 Tax=Streptomyces justiciae TaxID=2780140 RepID=UPI0021189A82|nr:NACHT domain-containing protein [Streptomyces justiciae]MCW8378360.1 AAA family ATPase [Streptomyces justiciae]
MRARIVTFYSYKGGTGRTMALANAAWILASRGKRVLVVDWDLEAPGLHRYFHPFLPDSELRSSPGIMDMVWEFATAATDPATPDEPDWHEPLAAIQPYAMSVEYDFLEPGSIDLVPAGRQDHLYSSLVSTFDWNNFYERLGGGGFIEALKRSMREHYDYVLIDSRTGLSDTAGICTVQLPDILVNCFTLSNQAIDGAEAVAASVHRQRAGNQLRMFPVPMRVDGGEADRLEQGRRYAQATFGRYLSHVPDPDAYWGAVEVPYSPSYAYEELLAPIRDEPLHPASLLASSERLVSYLTDREVTQVRPLEEPERRGLLQQFKRAVPEEGAATPRDPERPGRRVFITYAYDSPDHFEAVRELWFLLRGHGIDARLELPPGQRGEDWPHRLRDQLLSAELVLLVSSPGYRDLPDEEATHLGDAYYAYPDRFLAITLPGGSPDDLPDFLVPPRRVEAAELTAAGMGPVAELINRRTVTEEAVVVRAPVDEEPSWGPSVFEPELARAAEALAMAVRRDLREELKRRDFDDRRPLPLRWSLSRRVVSRSDLGRMPRSSGDLLRDPHSLFDTVPDGRLVLLGAPGSGKTTAAYQLATTLLEMGRPDGRVAVPLMLPLASWDPRERTLTGWIIDRVRTDHPVLSAELGSGVLARLVDEGWVLPFLDGLDELPSESRAMAIEALNRAPASMYVLTSRTREYETVVRRGGRPLRRASVLELEPLQTHEAVRYLSQELLPGDDRWGPVFNRLLDQPSHPLARALSTPFMLRMAMEVYRDPSTDPRELLEFPDSAQVQSHLLDGFIPAVYRFSGPTRTPPDRASRWLTFLARHMDRLHTRDFAWWELHRVYGSLALRLWLGGAALILMAPMLSVGLALDGGARVFYLAVTGAFLALVVLTTARSPRPRWALLPLPGRRREAADAVSPRQSLRLDRRAALLLPNLAGAAAVAAFLATGAWNPAVLLWAVMIIALPVVALMLRGRASPRYYVVVGSLALTRRGPTRLMRFLEEAHALGVLRRNGSVYQFRHAALQEVLAAQERQENL